MHAQQEALGLRERALVEPHAHAPRDRQHAGVGRVVVLLAVARRVGVVRRGRGQHDQAANFLRNAVAENPKDGEAWLALGNALVEHADGQLTSAALYAYSQAEQVAPENPAPTYFLGLSFLRAGEPRKTLGLWRELLETAPEEAEWREPLAARLARLETMLGMPPAESSNQSED